MINQRVVNRPFPGPVCLYEVVVLIGRFLEVPAQELDALLQFHDLLALFLDDPLLRLQLHGLGADDPKL